MINCVRCGSPVDQRVVFCGICGQSRVATPAPAPVPAPPPTPGRNPFQLLIASLLAMILVGGIAAAAYYLGREAEAEKPPIADSPSEPPPAATAPPPVSVTPPAPVTQPAPARAQAVRARCIVIDDSGTPLNVRASPNGRVVGGLLYGHTVEVVEVSLSPNGRYWSRINANNPIYRSGWVLSALIECETVAP